MNFKNLQKKALKNIRNEALSANILLPYLYTVSFLHYMIATSKKLTRLLLYSVLSTPSPCLGVGGETNTIELGVASVCCF